jgi:hypothetical protein
MQSQGLPEATPRPVLEVAYYAEEARSFLAIVRSIGVLAILIGGSTLIYVVAGLTLGRLALGSRSDPNLWMEMVYYIASVVVAIGLLMAGIGCLQGRPRGRRLLAAAAWGLLLVQVYALVATSWMMLTRAGGGLSISPVVPVITSQLRAACVSAAFPLIVLILTRHASIRNVFELQ